jgi:effector-binding domain-containing protein
MTVRKKIIIVCSAFLSLFLIWYLFVKKTDYCIVFKVNAATGTVFQGIQEWSVVQWEKEKEKYTIVEKRNFDFIKQEMKKGAVQMEYTWDIIAINDSVTKVSVGIKDLNHSWYNKLTAPFFNTEFKQEQIQKITDFKLGLSEHLKNFKVRIDGEGTSEEIFVAYISLTSVLQEKARNMIANDAMITGFLFENQIKIKGKPYVEIVKWDLEKETIDFNYCFPVEKPAKTIANDRIKFKTIPALKGLKATYFGNFRTSDRAWFAIMDYAKKHNIALENKVLEHFLSNPFNGGEELQWETKIIIPFASK